MVAASFMAFDESAWPVTEDTEGSTAVTPTPEKHQPVPAKTISEERT